jgi:hypothetical protein
VSLRSVCRGLAVALPSLAFAAGLPAAPRAAGADVFVLKNGDRITGRILWEAPGSFRVSTPYGRLTILRASVERLRRADGREVDVASTAPPPPPARVQIEISGSVFWYAWEATEAPPDPRLRLRVSLGDDGATLGTWTDARVDPEIRGAVVNTFSFQPADAVAEAGPGIRLADPDIRPGRVALGLELPAEAGPRKLRIAYQVNQATAAEPAWADVASASVEIDLPPSASVVVALSQDRGSMEFSGRKPRRMRNVDGFSMQARVE